MGQTMVEKICQRHLAEGPDRPLRTGDVISLRPRHVMTHDNTAPVIKKFKGIGATKVKDPRQVVFTLDHEIQNTTEENLAKYRQIEDFAKLHGIDFHPAGTGIGHQIMVSHGYVVPNSLVVASDSHSNMYGALGACGTPVVRTDAAAIWATGEFWWQIPRSIQVTLTGKMQGGATGKDVIITLCGLYNKGEVLNAAVEFVGPGVADLSMDERLAISNMTTEWGALVGWFPADTVTVKYLRARKAKLGLTRFSDADLAAWEKNPVMPDADAVYAGKITLDLGDVSPHVSGPDTVQVMRSVADIAKDKVKIQKAYLVSCVNSRLEDLEAAAKVIKGQKVAAGVEFYVAAASAEVARRRGERGLGRTGRGGREAVAVGCGMCIGLGVGLLEAGEVGISATNRNFKGRMGSRDAEGLPGQPAGGGRVGRRRLHHGAVRGGRQAPGLHVRGGGRQGRGPDGEGRHPRRLPREDRGTAGLPAGGQPEHRRHLRQGLHLPELTREEMAKVVMENYDPTFTQKVGAGAVIVGGDNFGTGSSREQAATALQAAGIPLVIAGSFSQTYLRNAYNNGFVCIECPELVADMRATFANQVAAKEPTIIPGDDIVIDFTTGTAAYRGKSYAFPALGSVPQSLYVAGGIEKLVQRKLGL